MHLTNAQRIVRGAACLLSSLAAGDRPKSKVGGQAIIEGVMMKSKAAISWAVRTSGGTVVTERFPFVSASDSSKILGLPVLRGAVSLWETLVWGIKAINRSAEIVYEEDDKAAPVKQSAKKSSGAGLTTAGSVLLAFAISILLFMYVPMLIPTLLGLKKSALEFNLLAGFFRVLIFLAYLVAISFWKDIRRMFEYHGAEHKAIFAFEDGKDLTLENMRAYRTFHPRCGTSFLLLVLLICIALFSVIDAVMIRFVFGDLYTLPVRIAAHLLLFPLVGGISYEVLKLSDRYTHLAVVRWLIAPGLWLQRITTREPDDTQMQVAVTALKAAL